MYIITSSESKVKYAQFFHKHWGDFGKGDLCLSPTNERAKNLVTAEDR